ncbi:uncharacterized protein [Cicer arietinum]|uniref:Probable inactive protein kinase DDB_G0270444 n=1 Tax=Cicer arietinum TaxID=3827 RepID=A0A1S2Y8X5_CICAR|nr:probable inactive protein kinase DDB_G0270444 [Cicer arietinum]
MATKTKDSTSVVGNKEKKTTSSNAPKRTTRPSTTSSVESSTTQSSEKHVPNYLKPTLSSQPRSQSFKLPRNDASNKPYPNRRRSFDKPQSLSRVPKQTPVASPSRLQHKPLVRNIIIPSSKSISKINPKGGVKKKTNSSVNTKNVATTKSTNNEETSEAINVVENEPEVKEAIINEENVEEKVENLAEIIPPQVENDQVEVEQTHGQDQNLEHIEYHDSEKVKEEIPIVLEEEEKQDQTKEENITNYKEECDNKEINHSTNEEEVEVKEENEEELEKEEVEVKEENEEELEKEEVEVKEKNEEELEKEEVEGGKCEEENEQVESEVKEEEEKKVDSSSKEDEDESCVVQGKKESQISNDVIQETASKLLEERKNKVRQLAGAFQTVIDHQTK